MKSTWRMHKLNGFNVPVLVADCSNAIKYANAAKEGQTFLIDLKVQRNVKQHKLFFSLLRMVVDNSDEYQSTDELLINLKIATKHVKTIIGYNGQTYYIPQSISFETMDQVEFQEFFKRCIDIICTRFVPTLNSADLEREFWGYLGQ